MVDANVFHDDPRAEGSWPFGNAARDQALLRVVERHVLPKLALRSPALFRPDRFGDGLSDEVPGLTDLALNSDTDRSQRVLHRLYSSGASFADLQLGLLAPAANRLDGLWRNDEVSFLDVTLAAGNIQRMMRFVALDLAGSCQRPPIGRAILIAPAPGETHVLGAAMAAEFFRRDGWKVRYEPMASGEELATQVRTDWTDVLGLSITWRPEPRKLRETVAGIRAASCNPDLLIIAGGEALVQRPHLLSAIGADATLAALNAAPHRAHRLVDALFGARA